MPAQGAEFETKGLGLEEPRKRGRPNLSGIPTPAWRLERQRQYFAKARTEALCHYSQNKLVCACCGEPCVHFLSLDHVKGDGATRKRNGEPQGSPIYVYLRKRNWPEGFQVLCFNCNWGKGQGLVCPHQLAEETV